MESDFVFGLEHSMFCVESDLFCVESDFVLRGVFCVESDFVFVLRGVRLCFRFGTQHVRTKNKV